MVEVDGVFFKVFGTGDGRLPVGCRGDHLLDRPLDVPAVFEEIGREPIDQVRMGGPIALRTEIARGVGQSPSEDGLPMPVGGYPCRERVLWIDNPFGQPKTGFGRSSFMGGRKPGVSGVNSLDLSGDEYCPRMRR